MKKNIAVLSSLVIINCIWNLFLYTNPDKGTIFNYLFNLGYNAIFIFGSVFAIIHLKKYPLSSHVGKSFLFYALSLGFYALALVVWSYYNLILKVPVPYPGISDLFFIVFQPFSILGFMYLLKSVGGKFTWVRIVEFIVLTAVIFGLLFSFLQTTSLGNELPFLERALNIIYPLQDASLIAIVIVGLRTERGALYPNLLIFAFAALAMAVADTIFSYRSATDLYWNGDFSDTAYLIAGSLFSLGLIMTSKFHEEPSHIKTNTPHL